MKNYGKYVLDIIVFQDVNGNEKIYSNHEGGMDGTVEDVVELMVTKQTASDNDISTVKISLANGQSSNVTVGEKVYLDIEIPESITNVDLTFSLEGNNEDNIGYLTFESTVKDLKTKPYIIIPELENEKLR